MPDVLTITSEAHLFQFLRELDGGEETFADFGNLSITVSRDDSQGHIIVGSGKTRDGGGVLPLNFTLDGLLNAVRDLAYLSAITVRANGEPR